MTSSIPGGAGDRQGYKNHDASKQLQGTNGACSVTEVLILTCAEMQIMANIGQSFNKV